MQDEQIIELFFERSEGAIEALKNAYGSRAMAVARKILGDTRDAEEAVNDAMHAIWQKIPPEKPRHLWAYFSRVVRNLSCDRLDYRNAAQRLQEAFAPDLSDTPLAAACGLEKFGMYIAIPSNTDRNDRLEAIVDYFLNWK